MGSQGISLHWDCNMTYACMNMETSFNPLLDSIEAHCLSAKQYEQAKQDIYKELNQEIRFLIQGLHLCLHNLEGQTTSTENPTLTQPFQNLPEELAAQVNELFYTLDLLHKHDDQTFNISCQLRRRTKTSGKKCALFLKISRLPPMPLLI